MAEFQVLLDQIRESVDHAFVMGRVWVFDGSYISVYARHGLDIFRTQAESHLTWAARQGFSDQQVWDYLVEGGDVHGYTELRSGPITVSGESALTVALAHLKAAVTKTPSVWELRDQASSGASDDPAAAHLRQERVRKEAVELLPRLVQGGLVVEVTFHDGFRLSPSPVVWLNFDGNYLHFLGDDPDDHEHIFPMDDVIVDDGMVYIREDGIELEFCSTWSGDQDEALQAWKARQQGVPDGGWTYQG